MIFDLKRKSPLFQGFLDNATPLYASQGLIGHTGVDYGKGYGTPVTVDNDCYVYKIIRSEQNSSNWQAVYTLVEDSMEVCFGHLSRVDVKEGQSLKAGDRVGAEGNRGDVFVGNRRITVAEQKAGSTEGSHVHESWRPVKRERFMTPGEHYLRKTSGSAYYANGYYQIVLDDARTSGMVDPLQYANQDTKGTILSLMKRTLVTAIALLGKYKK